MKCFFNPTVLNLLAGKMLIVDSEKEDFRIWTLSTKVKMHAHKSGLESLF